MQLYRGMDIGTAKLTPAERAGVPHHVLDIWDVTEPASVAEYQRLARAAVDDILARGRVPLLVGGSGLYVRAVLEEFEFPGTDPALRARLEGELAAPGRPPCTPGSPWLDPVAADRHPARQRTADRPGAGGDRADRPAVHRRAARRPPPSTTTCRSGWTWTPANWTSGSRPGWTGCGPPGWSTRSAR